MEILVKSEENYITRSENGSSNERHHRIKWFNVITGLIMHMIAIYGLFLMFTEAHIFTFFQLLFLNFIGMLGVTAGIHRLWSHRSYKAKWPLRLLLMLFATVSFQGTIYQWSRDHRVHHKYSDTHADPHNINNGFFFAHIGWLLTEKYPDVREKGSQIELQDLLADPIVTFQKKHIRILVTLITVILPTIIPMIFWAETFSNAFCLNMLRYFISLHSTLSINSFTHLLGRKPYDKNIWPTENTLVTFFSGGEGFHNFHHTFPWDYKASEFGNFSLNRTTAFIDLFAKIGWAYDLKTTSEEMVKKRCLKTGDGSHEIWGWGDKDQPLEDFREVTVKHKKQID